MNTQDTTEQPTGSTQSPSTPAAAADQTAPLSFSNSLWPSEKPLEQQDIIEIMGKKPRLLVVDDASINVQALFKTFNKDHQVYMATNGEQAVEVCAEKLPDLVLLDIEMPGINGFEACERMKANPLTKNIPVIFVTSHDNVETEARGLAVGAVDFITKPIHPEIVRARVRTHLILKHQADLLRQWVYMDGLTGAHNRRHFNERYSSEWGRAHRHGGPMSLIFIDVDLFKKYNDHYGHQKGDEVLRQVAGALKGVIHRAADMVARYGGEEFVCLLPETDAQGGYIVAKQMREAVESLGIEHIKSEEYGVVTISLGVVTYHGGCTSNGDDILRLADECLYRSKNRGRNRVSTLLAPWASGIPMPESYLPPGIDRAEDYFGP